MLIKALSWLSQLLHKRLLKTKRYFARTDSIQERKNIGLEQFFLLLTLTPLICSLNLYVVDNLQSVA
jgi:hypothetical protein